MVPPLNSGTSCSRRNVAMALAASAASPRTNVNAVGPSSSSFSASAPGLVRRALGEGVLDHPQGGVGLAQALAQLGDLLNGDAAVVDREHGLGPFDLSGHLVDDRRLLFLVHWISTLECKEPADRAGGLEGVAALRSSPAPGLRTRPPVVWGRKVLAGQATEAGSSVPTRAPGSTFTPGPIDVVSTIEWM